MPVWEKILDLFSEVGKISLDSQSLFTLRGANLGKLSVFTNLDPQMAAIPSSCSTEVLPLGL